ncbi:uncharacterized protein LOC135699436, partial [Ochlerotatus camptorhynchus]|uniref:uncharacterized protein LOC135699436 n=1 Tax=Ochlerotatus camptorhynchus TaxID=644619 RepID=UPI0031D47AF8
MDGFDEIHSKYTDKVIEMLEQLKLKKSIRIIISARKHMQVLLETSNGHKDVAELLISNNADVNAVDEDQWTAIHYAAENGHDQLIQLLIDRGSTVNTCYHGKVFQKQVAVTFFLRMRRDSFNVRLAYEVSQADKYDDVVIIDDEREVLHFIQVKHAVTKDGKVNVIDLNALFPTEGKDQHNGDFSIYKYLESYLKVVENFKKDQYKKQFYIFTNKDLNISDVDWVTPIEVEVDEILRFPGSKARHLKLDPTEKAIKELSNFINKDFENLKKAIKELFNNGTVSNILETYSTPLKDVLTIKKKQCSFLDSFNSESEQINVAKLFKVLEKDNLDMKKTITVNNFLLRNSRVKHLPRYFSEEEIVAFFNDFYLLVSQPNDLYPIIESELWTWCKSWICPEILRKLREIDLIFRDLILKFDQLNKPKKNKMKAMLKKSDVLNCLSEIQNDNDKLEGKEAKQLQKYYINRRIIYKYSKPTNDENVIEVEKTGMEEAEMNQRLAENLLNKDNQPGMEDKIEELSRQMSDTQFVEELGQTFEDHQIIVLLADPGMGKTSLLQFVAFEVQKQNVVNVLLVYLSELVMELEKVEHSSDLQVHNVLKVILSERNCDLIKNAPHERDDRDYSILIVMDGFDEIHSKYTDKVIEMLEQLKLKKSIRIIISARKHMQVLLESKFNVRSMFLEPFNVEDQINYFRKMWHEPDLDEHCFESYSKHILNTFKSNIPSNLGEICGAPLMVKMLAEVYLEKFRNYHSLKKQNTNQLVDLTKEKMNIAQLYEQFIRRCFHKKFMEKFKPKFALSDAALDWLMGDFILKHQLLAMELLNIEVRMDLLKNQYYKVIHDQFKKRCEQESDSSQLVHVVQQKVDFCHRSYSEYFVAKYLCDNIFTLSGKIVRRIWSRYTVVRRLSMTKMEGNQAYLNILNNLCKKNWKIALWACECDCLSIISSLEGHFKSFSTSNLTDMILVAKESGFVEIYELLSKNKAGVNAADEKQLKMPNLLQDGTYERKIQSGYHGEVYQKQVAVTFFLRMRRDSFNVRLAYEMSQADKYDDVVIIDDEREVLHFIQVKHAVTKDGKVNVIDLNALFPTEEKDQHNGDFSIYKYLESYLKVVENFKKDQYKKQFYIFTNKDLNISDVDWVRTVEVEVDEILRFPGSKARHLKLDPTEKAIKELSNFINKDFENLKKAIKELFNNGTVSNILETYSTPLKDVLTIKKKQCSFLDSFNSESEQFNVAKLFKVLEKDKLDMKKTITVNNFLLRNSRVKHLPRYFSEEEIVAFFNNFSLLVSQPNDLYPIIESELWTWCKSWICPEILRKLREIDLIFRDLILKFDQLNKPKKNKMKSMLKKSDVLNCLSEIQNDNDKLEGKEAKQLQKYYINRRIIYKYSKPTNDENVIEVEKTGMEEAEMNQRLAENLLNKDNQPGMEDNIEELSRQMSDTQFVEELGETFEDHQIIVLLADPGMGKTSLLQFVAFEVQKQNVVNVLLVYLSELVMELEKVKHISELKVLNVLKVILSERNCDLIENSPHERDDRGYSILILMDGFDEIHSKYTDKVIEMLEQLKLKKSIRIIISARKHMQVLLESKFNVRSMFLEPFIVEDQINYFRKMWHEPDLDERCFESYSKHILNTFKSNIPSNLGEICGAPLMVKMLAEVYLEKFRNYHSLIKQNTNQLIDLTKEKMNIAQLYEQFIRRCFHKKFMEKFKPKFDLSDAELDWLMGDFILKHQLLAMELLNIEVRRELFKNQYYRDIHDQFKNRCEQESDSSQLVHVVQQKVDFCHRSYSEYFVAKYLCDNIFTLSGEIVIRILSRYIVVRRLSMTKMEGNQAYIKILNNLCEKSWKIALWACECDCLSIISSLERHFKSFSTSNLTDMILVSAKRGFVETCELLLKNKADVNSVDKEQKTALYYAAQNGHDQLIKLLIDKGSTVNTCSSTGVTPLHIAASNGHKNVAELLISNNADVNAVGKNQWTAIHYAAQNGHDQLIQLLIDRGSTVNICSITGRTPLHNAASNGHKN